MNFVIDVSHYESALDIPTLKAGGVELVIIKASNGAVADPMFMNHYKTSIAGGMPVAVYHWCDPLINPEKQAQFLLETINGLTIQAIFMDYEQWWSDWGKWEQANAKAIPMSAVPKFSDGQISDCGSRLMAYLVAHGKLPAGVYFGKWFTDTYTPSSLKWIASTNYPVWLASYTNFKAGPMSWADFAAIAPDSKNTPPAAIHPGIGNLVGWQFTGNAVELPGIFEAVGKLSPADVSVFDPKWLASIGVGSAISTPTVTPMPPIQVAAPALQGLVAVVSVPKLNVRSGPGVQYGVVDNLSQNAQVEVLDVAGSDAWLQIGTGRWICKQLGVTTYVETKEQGS
jgi:GH25 family lysozyme M1 (1,4-beta-N-acetylmuramidase)